MYEEEYLRGIEHFNAHEFFVAHEVWEDIWARTTGRNQLYYKGLIHAAVALHHFGNSNLHGARKVWASCKQYLSPYAPHHLGLNVRKFLDDMHDCFAPLDHPDTTSAQVTLNEPSIPKIHLDPAADSGRNSG
jgi:predicted metal-dependent hydrolase